MVALLELYATKQLSPASNTSLPVSVDIFEEKILATANPEMIRVVAARSGRIRA